jgi:hypothetical protein
MNSNTEHTINEDLRLLKQAIRVCHDQIVLPLVLKLLKLSPEELWKLLIISASSEISCRETEAVLVVRCLYENWQLYKDQIFAIEAALVLCFAPKGTTAQHYLDPVHQRFA